MKNIKDYRSKELLWYTILQIIIIVIFQYPEVFNPKTVELQTALTKILSSTVFSSVICVFSFILDSVLNDNMKCWLIYFGQGRPGEKIFSNIKSAHVDVRYTKESAIEKYKDIYNRMPEDSKKRRIFENAEWYKIYSKYKTSHMILISHRDYLLCRDIYSSTVMMVGLYLLVTVLLNVTNICWGLILFELLPLCLVNIATRQRAKRFVENVIAQDLQEQPQILDVLN